MSIFTIFKNNFYRILSKKAIISVVLIFIPVMIASAVYFTGKMETKANIAVVSRNKILNVTNNKEVNIKYLDQKPKMSELLLNKYDAVIYYKDSDSFEVITIKNEKLKKDIEKFIKNPSQGFKNSVKEQKRGVGTNILGFLIMIILLQAVILMVLYPEDRDFRTFKRILIAPISEKKYLFAQGIFNFVIIYVPVFLSIVITKEIFKVNIGFDYKTLAILLSIIVLFGTAFALFMTSIIDDIDNSSMLAQFIAMLTSIISGSFYSFSDNNKILDSIVNALPQKNYLTLVQGIENGKNIFDYPMQLSYILFITIILFTAGSMITKRNLKSGKY
ncbi:ABC-2 type transport system permease protein [Clostridium tetanomorphum]|uniref:ABC transporter permease n=1 Tax=Clostridium tetanomorphum TaxID=1553 RepID=A0A923EBG6_CLOTT|nr:ABC transporter permease [Clostridium tetanomorphum]KAJ51665.1 ABC-type MDR transport system, permease [Clostridium tetanomorphum DSM 665]KAJ51945.1 ABC-type MDR transport system, permease [Clostridium tetanomorphum DSM 665]MBC2398674.1 ABC transporter permease [Clostridium tetanomorphum]MBP1864046.1 ABC-2 type transport system permease protein [Clostridium tetanomorphum]NRS84458.1 ABC-2 type transport system permease protein [Clostridium tetanomorphum]